MQVITNAEEPALGIPLAGTVVVGIPKYGAALSSKQTRASLAKSAKGKQAKKATPGRTAVQRQCQSRQLGNDHQGWAACASDKPQPKNKKKRKAVPCESPPRLPPISPGALSLQEGVKRRRLARQIEDAAAAQAASGISQAEAQPSYDQPDGHMHESLQPEATAATEDCSHAQASVGHKQSSSNASAATEVHALQGMSSQIDCDRQASAYQQQHLPEGKGQVQPQNTAATLPQQSDSKQDQQAGLAAGCHEAEHGRQGQSACPQMYGVEGMPEQQTLSFDVAAMELFQQQDTCDAFGSFWRRTTGAGLHSDQDQSHCSQTAPSAFGGWHAVLSCLLYCHVPCLSAFECHGLTRNLQYLCSVRVVCSKITAGDAQHGASILLHIWPAAYYMSSHALVIIRPYTNSSHL